jgi:hypothetical protein
VTVSPFPTSGADIRPSEASFRSFHGWLDVPTMKQCRAVANAGYSDAEASAELFVQRGWTPLPRPRSARVARSMAALEVPAASAQGIPSTRSTLPNEWETGDRVSDGKIVGAALGTMLLLFVPVAGFALARRGSAARCPAPGRLRLLLRKVAAARPPAEGRVKRCCFWMRCLLTHSKRARS